MKKSLKALPLLAVAGLGFSAVTPVLAQEGSIGVVSREDGSGTRGAFVEIVGVVDEDDNDMTTLDAVIQNSTNGVMQTVAGDSQAIGYISLGSVDDSIKVLPIDGVEASAENVTNGTYPIARPFNVAWSNEGDLSEVAADFLTFIHSADGQAIVEEEGYVQVTPKADEEAATEEEATEETTEESTEESTEEAASEEAVELPAYEVAGLEGTVEVVGSTSVTPVMEKLAEAYSALNEGVTINITSNGSSAGMEAAINGTADLGMASRELDEEEQAALNFDAIAIDGIAVIAHPENPISGLTLENVKQIFLGEVTEWEEVAQ
ncbi:phosphate-binding protein [Aerococcaceae bacterium DSM 109653]|uniref:Phosphate-binding protein n=1 Tax=Fundicoccus ignavus TaxID=2664442 RepID=A0A844BM16_9LACT|nr:substrate-binding domain-containing protein [Fundicoccus ignavus]MRI82144.1 phosphate-binding protein [Fundicoccus ignavus]